MNKKLFLGMFVAAGMLLATSCSNDELDVVQSGNEAQVTFSLAAEGGIATRAISDGKSADLLYYAIFDADGILITTINGSTDGLLKKENAFPNGSKEDNVEVTLAKGQEYTAVFWAQDASCDAYTVTAETDGLKVAVDYEGDNNDETRDAFFKAEPFTVTGNTEIPVVLKRPFAQINVGVTDADWKAAAASGVTISESKVVIKNAATSINLLDGTVSGEQVVEYDFAAIPNDPATLEVDVDRDGTIQDSEKYHYLSMSYILTSADRTTLEADGLQFTFSPVNGEDIIFDEGLHAVPVQRNWRTNILGKLLTGDIQFNIVIDEIFYDDYNYPEFKEVANGVKYDAATKTYYLYSAAGLQWLSTETNTNNKNFSGYTVKLTSDVDMMGISFDPIGKAKAFLGTFDGGNNTISNLTITGTEKSVGLFANARTVKNIKMSNVNITGSDYVGAIVGYGINTRVENCHVDGGTITANVLNKDGGAKVGGIVGYLTSQPDAWVKDCSVKNVTVKGYRDVGGIAGMAQLISGQCYVDNVSIDNVTVIADMIAEYTESGKEANAGAVVGRNAGATISNETKNNVTVNVYKVENNIATVGTADGLIAGLEQDFDVVLAEDVKIDPAGMSNAYGTTGINVKNGQTIDGGGNTLDVKGAGGTWDSGINTTGGLIKNLTVTGSFRGIFINHNSTHNEQVVLDNVIIDGTTYTISCDQGANQTLKATNSIFKGWTSYAATLGEAEFIDCYFGESNGYSFCRPYAPTSFTNCEFENGFQMDPRAACTFENCKLNGVLLTAENIATLVTSNIANATVK